MQDVHAQLHTQFIIPGEMSIDTLMAILREHAPLQAEPPSVVRRAYYDTFDWRIYTAGSVLEEEIDATGANLRLRPLASEARAGGLRIERMPRFAWDLPPGATRDRLTELVAMRALLTQANIRSTLHGFRMLDENEKTVVRIVIEENSIDGPDAHGAGALQHQIRVHPIKGYPKPLQQVSRLLAENLALEPVSEDMMLMALRAQGRSPGGYTSKLSLRLDPDLNAQAVTKHILLELLQTIEANEAGTVADLDSEFLHDFRVAIRRTRSALSQIKGVFPAQALNGFRQEFGWLGQITGPTRDLDVYLLKFDDYRNSLPEDVRDELTPLKAFLVSHQRKAQRDLAKALECPRYRTLLQEWREFLMAPGSLSPDLPNAQRPISEVANERIWRVYRRAIKEGRAIGPETPAEDLHELRKTCKKLRYLMEFFQSLYPAGEIKILIKALKALQENLGDFQDLEVQGTQLKHFSQQMMEESRVSAATLMAMGVLVADLMKRQHRAREDFAACFKGFAAATNRALFKKLFATRTQEVTLAP